MNTCRWDTSDGDQLVVTVERDGTTTFDVAQRGASGSQRARLSPAQTQELAQLLAQQRTRR